MRTLLLGAVVIATGIGWTAATADAGIIVSLAGDKDSFGTGKPDGSTVSVNEITVPGGEDGDFDQWARATHTWTHTFILPPGESIVGATLSVATLDMEDDGEGDGAGGAPFDDLLFLDGVEFPGAFDDVFTADANADTQIIPNVTLFDLTGFLGSLSDGTLTVLLDAVGGARFDAISVDYAELTIVTRSSVPEPSTLAVLLIGAFGLVTRRRR